MVKKNRQMEILCRFQADQRKSGEGRIPRPTTGSMDPHYFLLRFPHFINLKQKKIIKDNNNTILVRIYSECACKLYPRTPLYAPNKFIMYIRTRQYTLHRNAYMYMLAKNKYLLALPRST